jgi:hypothetical protein
MDGLRIISDQLIERGFEKAKIDHIFRSVAKMDRLKLLPYKSKLKALDNNLPRNYLD